MSDFFIPISATGGGVLGYTATTAPQQVVAANIQNNRLIFINVGATNILYVCQQKDANGAALTAGANPGNIPVFPGGTFVITGPGAQSAWFGATSTSTTPITVIAVQDGP